MTGTVSRRRMLQVSGAVVAGGAVTAPTASAAEPPAPPPREPDIELARLWWPQPRGVWTPVGWRDHIHKFSVLYTGSLFCEPGVALNGPRESVKPYLGQGFQLTTRPWPEPGVYPWPEPELHPKREEYRVYQRDLGAGLQGWQEDHAAPVLWTEWRLQEGLVIRQYVFAHVKGGKAVEKGDEPLYAWVRFRVEHVDPRKAPKSFPMAVRLTKTYMKHRIPSFHQDWMVLDAVKEQELPTEWSADGLDGGGLRIGDKAGVRMAALPAENGGAVRFTRPKDGERIYNLASVLPAEEGAHADLLVAMTAQPREEFDRELRLGYEGALAEAERFWSERPKTAATVRTPEPYVNEAIARNVGFAETIAEKSPVTGEYSFLSGAYGYDVLWGTPTSMISHMFLDLLGHHDVVDRHIELFRKHQGEVKPAGDAYKEHRGYLGVPRQLVPPDWKFDWLSDHGAILHTAAYHGLLSGDEEFIARWTDAIVAGCDFIKDACAQSDHDGVKGLLPPGTVDDAGSQAQSIWGLGWHYRGLTSAVELLRRTGHARAAEFAELRDSYHRTFVKAYRERAAKEPTWKHPDGGTHPILPRAVDRHLDDAFSEMGMMDTGPLFLVWSGLMRADDPLLKPFADYFRVGPNARLRFEPRGNPLDRAVLRHEMASGEPCYSWNVPHSWQLGDRARFLEGMYSLFAGGIAPDTYINGEHRHGMYGTVFVAPLMMWCARMAVVDDEIEDGELHLLRLCPLAWVSDGRETRFERMPTRYGPVDLRWRRVGGRLEVAYEGATRGPRPRRTVLHVPPGLSAVTVNGRRREVGGGRTVVL
ncbi:hypothetical protein [Streptomyces boninensis]|uniref:hypothetical protein n=1 Tax=Streptomyces boninensis TaxID=2039455 RepID=UPI003B222AE1